MASSPDTQCKDNSFISGKDLLNPCSKSTSRTVSSTTTNLNLQTLFGSDFTDDSCKTLVIEQGVSVGSNTLMEAALSIPSGMGGTMKIINYGSILGAGGGSVPHHHLNSFDKTFNLDQQKFSLTYYLSVGDQNCDEPGIFKIYEPDEEVLPSNGMIMIIPSSRKHSAVYGGTKDRVMIGVNFYLYN